MEVLDKAVSSTWEEVSKAVTELGEADLEKKRHLFEKLMKKRSELYINIAEVNSDLKLQSLRIEKFERKCLSFKDKRSSSQGKAKNSKNINEISDLLEKGKDQTLKKKTYLMSLQKKLRRIDRKIMKMKSSTVEELRLAKLNKKLLRRVRDLEKSAQSEILHPQQEEPGQTPLTDSTNCPFETPFHGLIEFLSNFISSKASSIECPVCYSVPSPPIYRCPNSHIICSTCLPRVSSKCPTCRTRSGRLGPKQIHRHAEGSWKELDMIKTKVKEIHPL